MAVPVILIRAVVSLVVRGGSRFAQAQLVRRGAVSQVRGNVLGRGLVPFTRRFDVIGGASESTILGSAFRRNGMEFAKNVLINALEGELADLATSGIVHYQITREERLLEANKAARAASEEARLEAAFAFAQVFIGAAIDYSPTDSQEYRNKWIECGRILSLTRERERQLQKTKLAETLAERLERRAQRLEELADARQGPLRAIRARQDLAEARELRRRIEQLDDPRAEIAGADEIGPLIDIPPMPPPAEARVEVEGNETMIVLRNTVPYATEVERSHLVMGRALAATESASERAGERFVGRINRARASVGARTPG